MCKPPTKCFRKRSKAWGRQMSSQPSTVKEATLAPLRSTILHSLFWGVFSTGDGVEYTGLPGKLPAALAALALGVEVPPLPPPLLPPPVPRLGLPPPPLLPLPPPPVVVVEVTVAAAAAAAAAAAMGSGRNRFVPEVAGGGAMDGDGEEVADEEVVVVVVQAAEVETGG